MKLASKIVECNTLLRQGTGLMFRWPGADFAYVFSFSQLKKRLITMWWVFFSIDILFLDEKKRIVEVATSVQPFSHYYSKKKHRYFIELPKGTASQLWVGSSVTWNKTSLILKK